MPVVLVGFASIRTAESSPNALVLLDFKAQKSINIVSDIHTTRHRCHLMFLFAITASFAYDREPLPFRARLQMVLLLSS